MLKPDTPQNVGKHKERSVCQLKRKRCSKKYVGETGRTFWIRHNEHVEAIKYHISNSKYSSRILENSHILGNIQGALDVLQTVKTEFYWITLEVTI
jgi:hypothetical protein